MAGSAPAAAGLARRPSKVAVASEHSLVAEAIRAALTARGFDVVVLRWPLWMPDAPGMARRRGATGQPHLGLIVSDLDQMPNIAAARVLLAEIDVPWVVLSAAPQGPAWGAVFDVGAEAVLSSATTLDELVDVLDEVVTGDLDAGDEGADLVLELVAQWQAAETHRRCVEAGVATLTGRELEVLQALHAGETVRDIAPRFKTTEATVRSQVKSVLRKLEVGTQVAAAAAYELTLER